MIIGLLPDMGNWVHSMGYFKSLRETISTAFKKKYILQRAKTKFILKKQKETVYYVCSKVYKTMK